jgi:hypothetical protein
MELTVKLTINVQTARQNRSKHPAIIKNCKDACIDRIL